MLRTIISKNYLSVEDWYINNTQRLHFVHTCFSKTFSTLSDVFTWKQWLFTIEGKKVSQKNKLTVNVAELLCTDKVFVSILNIHGTAFREQNTKHNGKIFRNLIIRSADIIWT